MQRRLLLLVLWLLGTSTVNAQINAPKVLDDRLSISLFSSEPDVVTPTGIAVDQKGRVFCIESHTHFRPKDYGGPKADRIRIYEDTNGDGKADEVSNFFEGSVATMNMAFAPDGSLYVATRAKVFRLQDKNNDNQADTNTLIVNLKTEGNYPHNGLSGLAFQGGRLYFGFGENLGVDYELVGSDGKALSGGGEGGNVFSCKLDGSDLEHFATGFWNPFGLAFDRTGNLIGIDNDPDWRPPCRLLHIVKGGDYGYRFSHGRRGTHPFTAWFGELPGSLGMISGTGEAPSGIVRYDAMSTSPGHSSFLTTSWGLHSIERYQLEPNGASFVSKGETIIKGEKDFRPVALALGPDGTIYFSDWVKRSYELHGHGRIWKVSTKNLTASKDVGSDYAFEKYPYDSNKIALRQKASNRVPADEMDFGRAIQGALSPLEKANLIRRSGHQVAPLFLLTFLGSEDPYIRQAARNAIEQSATEKWLAHVPLPGDPKQRTGIALVMRKFSQHASVTKRLGELLDDDDPDVRLVALKWIGEEKLDAFNDQLQVDIVSRPMTGRLFESYLAAIDLISRNRKGAEFEKAEANILAKILDNPKTRPDTLVIALRKLQSVSMRDSFNQNHPKLKIDLLKKLLEHKDKTVVREAVRTIRDLATKDSQSVLLQIAGDKAKYGDAVLDAAVGLSPDIPEQRALIIGLVGKGGDLSQIARQLLVGVELTREEARRLRFDGITQNSLIRQPRKRAQSDGASIDSIVRRLDRANARRGESIFFNQRFGQCAKCHQVDGRGGMIGPDLSNMNNVSVERLLESMILPSKEIAPRHMSWLIQTYDGKTFTGVLVAERGEVQTFADSAGKLFRVKFDEIERMKSVDKSIMPDSLLDLMTDQEVADLVRFLKRDSLKSKK